MPINLETVPTTETPLHVLFDRFAEKMKDPDFLKELARQDPNGDTLNHTIHSIVRMSAFCGYDILHGRDVPPAPVFEHKEKPDGP